MKTENASFLGKAQPLVMARLVCAAMTFTIPLVLARWLPLAEYGTYKQLFLLSQSLYYLLPFGMTQSLYFFIPRTDQKRPYFGQTLTFLLVVGAVACVALWAMANPVSRLFQNPALAEHAFELGLYTAFLMGAYPLEVGLTTQGKTRASAVCYLVSDGLRTLIMLVPVLFGFGLHGMMAGLAVFAGLRLIITWVVLTREGTGKLWDRRLFMNQLVYAAPFGAAMALSVPQQYLHQFAVSSAFPPELFALYAVGCFQLPLVDLLYTPTSEVLMVRLGELERQKRAHEGVLAFREAVRKLSFIFLPLATFLFAAAPEFVSALFGARFLPAVPMFRVSILAVVLAILPMDGVLRARNQTRHIFWSYLVKAVVTVPLVYAGIHFFGMMGAIGAWALAELVGKTMLFVRLPKALGVEGRASELIPWKALSQAMLSAGFAALSVLGLRQIIPDLVASLPHDSLWRMLPLMVAGGFFFVGYFSILWCTGVQPTSVLFVLRRRATAA